MISQQRIQLKNEIKELASQIKIGRKNGEWVGYKSTEFMYKHIVASLLRGTPLNKIITEDKKQGMIKLDYSRIKNLLLKYGVGHKYLKDIFEALKLPYPITDIKTESIIVQEQTPTKSFFQKLKQKVSV